MALGTTTIRPARISDASALPSIERSALLLYGELPGCEALQDGPVIDQVTHTRWMRDGFYLVGEKEDGRRIGFLAALRLAPGRLVIPALAVRRAYQRRGLGRTLLERCVESAASHGIAEIWLELDTSFEGALALCRSLQFGAIAASDVPTGLAQVAQDDPRPAPSCFHHRKWLMCRPEPAAPSIRDDTARDCQTGDRRSRAGQAEVLRQK